MIQANPKTHAWLFLVICLVAFVGAGWFLVNRLRTAYADQLSISIWLPVRRPVQVSTALNGTVQRTVLLFGDSRMAQWKPAPPPGVRVINAGMPGATTGELRLELPALLDEFKPDCLVIEAGINDLKLLGIRPARSGELVGLVLTNLSALADEGLDHHCQVLLLTTWPTASPELARRMVWSEAVPHAIDELNRQLSSIMASRKEVRVVDLLSRAGITPDEHTFLNALHLRPATYERLTPLLWAAIENQSDAK